MSIGLQCQPNQLSIGDMTASQVVKIRLPQPPAHSVAVFFSSPSLIFSKCMLKFDNTNWNQFQDLIVAPSPMLQRSPRDRAGRIDFLTASRDPNCHRKTFAYSTTRSGGAGGVCRAAGDPHFVNFGGRAFDFMGRGVFYYVKSRYLTVQAALRGIGYPSIATGFAVRYGNSRWMITTQGGECTASPNLDGITINRSGRRYMLMMNDGAVVDITHHGGHMDIVITLPAHYRNRVAGICGNIGTNQFFLNPGNVPTGNVNQMGHSYAVPPQDNMFSCAARRGNNFGRCAGDGPLAVHGKFHQCTIPVVPPVIKMPEVPKPEIAIKVPNGAVEEKKPPAKAYAGDENVPYDTEETPAPKIDPKCQALATQKCQMVLTHERANKIIAPVVKDCVFDYCALGNHYAETWKRQYYGTVLEKCRSIMKDTASPRPLIIEASTVLNELCLNGQCTATCCKNGGKLTTGGCQCPKPWTGVKCEQQC